MSRESATATGLAAKRRALLAQVLKERGLELPAGDAIVPRADPREMPLSFAQQRLWFLDQLEPESPRYNILSMLRLEGTLQVPALERSLSEILSRHEALRARFIEVDGQPELRLAPAEAFPLTTLDLGGLSPAERASELLHIEVGELRRPFDLAVGPLVRATLLRLGADEHVLLLSMHHIVSDGWSMGVLTRELWALYEAFREGKPSPLPALGIQYADFAAWQRRWLQGEVLEKQLSYWRRHLEGLATLEFPTDRPRPAVQGFKGASRFRLLPADLIDRMKALSQREGVTLYMALLAAFAAWLRRSSGQDDISVGSPIANRPRAEVEGLIGFLTNTLVVRTNLSGDPTFRELLGRVRDVALAAYAHQDVPFEKLVEELNPKRHLSRSPLFQVAFVLESDASTVIRLPGLTVSPAPVENPFSKFDLTFYVFDADRAAIGFEYSTDLFEAASIDRMLGQIETLLDGVASDPGRRISQVPLLSEGDQQALAAWNATDQDYPRGLRVHELIEAQAARTPEAVALVLAGETVDYRELNARANRLAHRLRALGVGPETRVGICMTRSVEMVVGLLGILKAGGAYVPLDASYPRERLAYMLDDAGCRVVLTQAGLLPNLPPMSAPTLCLDQEEEGAASGSDQNPAPIGDPETLAYVMYTSGSTGRPKGVMVTHRSLVNYLSWAASAYAESGGGALVHSPLAFDLTVTSLVLPLASGHRVELLPEGEIDAVANRLRKGPEIGLLKITPAHMKALGQLLEDEDGSRWARMLVVGGEALYGEDLARVSAQAPETWLVNEYGPTETVVGCCVHQVRAGSLAPGPVPIGRPIANTRLYVVDEHFNPTPFGVRGELLIGGAGVTRGYWSRPDLTAERFVPDPFGPEPGARLYRTGDLVRHRADGNLEYLGRIDEQVKVRGFRIEPGEIEAVLGQHPGVKDAAVIAREEPSREKRLVAYVVPRSSAKPSFDQLRELLRSSLPEYMVPSAVVFLEALPLTPNGKLDRAALPAPEGPARADQALIRPRNDLEREIAAIWRAVLGVDEVGVNENFFDLGGHSLTLLQVYGKLRKGVTYKDVKVVDLFKYPTVGALAAYVSRPEPGTSDAPKRARKDKPEVEDDAIAIIGMAGRFPGARDLDEFWQNLRNGVESISFFSAEELEAEGIPAALARDARYVKARGVLEGTDLFDAPFFGYNAREAEIMDPQHRVFLENAWTALEGAGYDASRYPGKVGVYAGTSLNTYAFNLISNPDVVRSAGGLGAVIASDKDFLTTRVSYKLNLRGPSVVVQTACSTSLVAVHLACRSLINHECDIGLAGGVSVAVPQRTGHLYEEEGILSPDGHCRAFDRGAQGTVGGSGVGIVVLKRLRDALADGDTIEAVIKGSAINNDGASKVGYTAPGVEGQAEVIAMAQAAAGMEPETIGYVEAHGTGTALGDPIEVQALMQVFGSGSNGRKSPCLIGSLKSNVGHLDAAAGVGGLIKTVLALKHRQIPPTVHFEEPNPKIDFASSPFRVSALLSEWPAEGTPRRAAVSSFGIGGTNAHVVLEEAPPPPASEPARRPFQLLLLSARTPSALDQATRNLSTHLSEHSELDLSDAAYTLQVARRAFRHRRIAVCRDLEDARRALGAIEPGRLLDGDVDRTGNGVAFLFPGQGAQHVDMGRGLYQSEEAFRTEVDRCAGILRPDLGFDLRDVLYPAAGKEAEASLRLDETALAQPALFVFEYALARLWMAWGVMPDALLGHSIGEYVAACLAGVFSLDDALSLVAARGRLMQDMPKGSMLAVSLPEKDVQSLLDGSLALAATNGPSQCVVSGPREALEALEGRLSARGVDCHRLRTSHAFHSPMMEPVLGVFRERVAAVKRQAPRVRYISNLTGTWATAEQAVDPGYWAQHLRETVRFSQGLGELLKEGRVLVEVGPGQSLSALARQHPEWAPKQVAVASARHPRESRPDEEVLLGALGRLWLAGVDVDWDVFHSGERRRRVALPTYPFERQRYWVDARPGSQPVALPSPAPAGKKGDIADWFYRPTWSSSGSIQKPWDPRDDGAVWMVFVDECGLGRRFAQRLDKAGCRVVSVEAGEHFERRGTGEYTVRPSEAADYDALFGELRAEGSLPDRIVHAWGVTRRNEPPPPIGRTQDLGFYSLIFLAQALGNGELPGEMGITVVTSGMQGVSGGLACPAKATVLGPCRVIPQEYAELGCRSVDIVVPESGVWRDDEIDRLLAECGDRMGEPVVAYRGGERWVETFEAFRVESEGRGARLRERGVYLITGGLGGIGLELATFLAEAVHARLVLVGRKGLPPREEWRALLDRDGEADATSRRIRKVQAIEAHGGEVLVLNADVSDRRQMEEAIASAEARFGRIHGVIHSAGVAPGGVIQLKTREMAERVLAPKVLGTLVLEALLKDRQPDFIMLCSSLSSVLGEPGQADYCAANAFQDAFARRSADAGGPFVLSLNWDAWMETGMAVEGDAPRDIRERQKARLDGILSAEGAEVFARALRQPLPQLLVSTVDLEPRLALFRALRETVPVEAAREPRLRHPRLGLATAYVAPHDEVEQIVAELWQELLGFELVGVDDDFFDLGGHSLLAIQITNWLRQTFKVSLKLQTLFDAPTVAGLARAIVANEPRPGQAREIARLALSVEGLSDVEVERMLEQPQATEGSAR